MLNPCWPCSFCFCAVLPSLWTRVLHRGRKQERCREGGELSLSFNPFVSWCNQLSFILFDYFFFAPFCCCCCYFSFFLRVGIFSPQSFPSSSFPCDPPETGNHLGCKGLLVGHWSPAVASSSFQAVNPSQATRGILHTSPLLPHRSPWKNSQRSQNPPAEGPDGMDLGNFGLKKTALWPLEC